MDNDGIGIMSTGIEVVEVETIDTFAAIEVCEVETIEVLA
jgi:hypothetical protein